MPLDHLDYSILEDNNGILLESAQLDLDFSKQLLPSPSRSDVIASHLTSIRTQFPKMNEIEHKRKWIAGHLVISNCKKPIDECIELINATDYGPVEVSTSFESTDSFLLKFERPYNPEILAKTIEILCDCSSSVDEASLLLGVSGNVEMNVYGENEAKYTFSIKMEKSAIASRAYKHFWRYSVSGQIMNFIVHLENEWEVELK